MTDKCCGNCRSSWAPPDGQGQLYCRRFPPTAHMVGSTQIGNRMTPLYDNVFPMVAAHLYCDEHRLKTAAMQTDGNVTRLTPPGEENGA